jgi:adenylate kinase family enzyme
MSSGPVPAADPAPRIHITGASGSGTTTLGERLAAALDLPHLDSDDYFWRPSEPPFTSYRPERERLSLLLEAQGVDGWVLSGSLMGWGDVAVQHVDLIVLLTAPTNLRLDRLRARERARFGARIEPDGDMHDIHRSFIDWASHYDDDRFDGRSLRRHRAWLARQKAPSLTLDATRPPDRLLAQVLEHLSREAG